MLGYLFRIFSCLFFSSHSFGSRWRNLSPWNGRFVAGECTRKRSLYSCGCSVMNQCMPGGLPGRLVGTPFAVAVSAISILYTSDHKSLDAERGSCLMHTHWNTVSNNRQSLSAFPVFLNRAWFDCVSSVCCNAAYCGSSSSTFPGQGFESQSRQLFRFFSFSQLFTTVNQWRILFEELYRSINMSCHSESHHKKLPWLGFEPQTWKRGTGTATAYCFTLCSNGCSLGNLLFLRQDNHVHTCTAVYAYNSVWTDETSGRFRSAGK